MRLRLALLGVEVIDFTLESSTEATEPQDDPTGISGGSGHNFERSYDTQYEDGEDLRDLRFGFQRKE